MKKVILSMTIVVAAFSGKGQTTLVSDFESVNLPDYHNKVYNDSTNGAGGFKSGSAFFPTFWAGYWSAGWIASAFYDSTTAGYTNPYGCAAYKGYNNSSAFAMGTTFGSLTVRLTDSLIGKTVTGMYICNSTYDYKSMKFGDAFAKKFGDTTGTHCGCAQGSYPDWFKLTVKRYYNGMLQNDSVEAYLADFRSANNVQDYILNTWTWINLSILGNTDSLAFYLSSSDNGSFGMNTPAYFCVDNLTLSMTTGIADHFTGVGVEVYPNPANDLVEIAYNANSATFATMKISDLTGREMVGQSFNSFAGTNKFKVDVSAFPAGVYYITLNADGNILTKKLIKQ